MDVKIVFYMFGGFIFQIIYTKQLISLIKFLAKKT